VLGRLSSAAVRRYVLPGLLCLQFGLFFYLILNPLRDPASDPALNSARQSAVQERFGNNASELLLSALPEERSWAFSLEYMSDYQRVNEVLRYRQRQRQHAKLEESLQDVDGPQTLATLWQMEIENERLAIERAQTTIARYEESYGEALRALPSLMYFYQQALLPGGSKEERTELRRQLVQARHTLAETQGAHAQIQYLLDRRQWLEEEAQKVTVEWMPLLSSFHWEDDAGGQQSLNQYVDWWHLTRINRKDLLAGLLFGVRISMTVGLTAVLLSLVIGIPMGALAGYYGGRFDMVVFRLIEIWESMPVFFMLLMVVAITQSKSIFLVVAVLGIFGWTGFSRYIRGEFLKQRHLPYVDACRAMGFGDARIVFSHILPNAIPPLLTLLPFAILGAITSEAGLSFLGLGEEGSCSWGVLMDEGRTAFPGESYLLWPPALMLTGLLVAIALVGDALRDALDPKLRH
jgi:peptide/nickel transport system permease protein